MQPTKLVDTWLRPTRGALNNARGAVVNLAGAVADRLVLTAGAGPGPKLQAAERRELVAFEVDDVDEEAHTGISVVVVGRASREPDEEDGPTPWADGPRRHLVRIRPTRVSGRRLS